MAYLTLSELRGWLGIDDSVDDSELTDALSAAEAAVDDFCGRKFSQDANVVARAFRAFDPCTLRLPGGADISTTTGLIVKTDDNDDGTYETTWTITTDFVLETPGGYGYNAASGWPFTVVHAVGSKWFPTGTLRPTVQITAKFGWVAVPAPVKHATRLLAAEYWKLKDAPFGVAGFGEFGVVRVRSNPKVAELLARYRHGSTSAVIA